MASTDPLVKKLLLSTLVTNNETKQEKKKPKAKKLKSANDETNDEKDPVARYVRNHQLIRPYDEERYQKVVEQCLASRHPEKTADNTRTFKRHPRTFNKKRYERKQEWKRKKEFSKLAETVSSLQKRKRRNEKDA